MSKDKISEYAFTPAANTDIGGINIDEGCAPSGINNAIRTLMTQIRDLQAGVSGDTIPLTAGGTGSGTAASARAALGLAIGTNVLGYVTPGASGNILQSDGTNWTSKASTAVTLDTITGGPLAIAKGGTNATTAAQARTSLGLAIGTDVLGYVTAGATGNVLTSTGTGWTSQAASGGQLKTELFTSPGTWTNPGSITQVRVIVVGGGGGGGTGSPTGGLGGFGGLAAANFTIPTSPVTITVGSGGAGKGPGTGSGSAGGSSSFGPYLSATGGAGGGSTTVGASGSGTISAPALPGGLRSTCVGSASLTTANGAAAAGGIGFICGPFASTATGPAALTYSISSDSGAGSRGLGGPTPALSFGVGGVSGAVIVEFIG